MAEFKNQGFGNQGYGGGRQMGGSRPESTSGTSTLSNVAEGAQNIASSVAETAGEAWEATKHGAQQVGSMVAGAAETAWEDTVAFLRRYPVATLCAGICLGFVLALAVRRSASTE